MKYIISICLLSLMFLLMSCATNILRNKRIAIIKGIWQTEKIENNFKRSDNSLRDAIEDAKNTIYVFNENMTAEIHVRNITNKARWDLKDDQLVLEREDEQMKFRIEKINDNNMILISDFPNGILKYYLSKIKNK